MRKLGLRPLANDTRPVRRSLVELTEAASRAADDGLAMMPSGLVMISPDVVDVAHVPARTVAAKPTAPPRAEPVTEPPSRGAAEMLAQIAKDQQARALDNMRLSFAAAMDYAKDFSRTPMPADRDPPRDKPRTQDKKTETNLLAGAAAEYRAEAVELARANLAASLDYARDLVGATTSGDFVALSSALARKQCELLLKQAAVLQSFARKVTMPDETSENG